MRNWMNLINEALVEDLFLKSTDDHEVVLDDPCNDEVDALKKASPEKKKGIMKKLERDINDA